MIKVTCELSREGIYEWCVWEGLEKHRWEHIVNSLYRQGGNAMTNICPQCGCNTLKIDFREEKGVRE